MAIQFARIEIAGRSSGSNACCKGAYNARSKVTDMQTNITYNFSNKGDNVYHAMLLPEHADQKFNSVSEFTNEVERCEKRKDSQLFKDIVLALPDDKELSLQDRINITHLLIEKRGWVKEGLGVQVDIHEPHDGEKNWHAHLLVTTRRFTSDGLTFGLKATDLNPEFKKAGSKAFVVPEAQQIHAELKDIINDYFRYKGLENRVDEIVPFPQEHIGPVRMRKGATEGRNTNMERYFDNLEHFTSATNILEHITRNNSVFTERDVERALKVIPNTNKIQSLVYDTFEHQDVEALYHKNGEETGLYTTNSVRIEELKIMRLVDYVAKQDNVTGDKGIVKQHIADANASLSMEQQKALVHLLLNKKGIRILRGRAGTGKSYVLGKVASIAEISGINVIGLAPTHKARTELSKCGYEQNDTIKGMLFKLYNNRVDLPKNSLIVIDEAGMVGNDDYKEILRVAAAHKCNVILAGDERQLSSIQRGGMFESLIEKIGSQIMFDIQRQDSKWGKDVAEAFSSGDAELGVRILRANKKLEFYTSKSESVNGLFYHWQESKEAVKDRLIVAIRNEDVDLLNARARVCLKQQKILTGSEITLKTGDKKLGYMQGDRIVFKTTNLALDVSNGDFATLKSVSKNSFKLQLDTGKEIEFNPNDSINIGHGYASTVYKAQGASIKEVHVLHTGFSTMRNSYVSLSRHVKDLRLYTNIKDTPTISSLSRQLKLNPERGSSLDYHTAKELEELKIERSNTLMSRVGKFMHKQIVAIVDKRVNDPTYYKYVKSEPIIIKVVDSHKEDGKQITNEWGKGVEAYNINKNIANFTKQIAESTQARDALFLIRDRQNYLADLHNNLQHTGHEELLLNHITQAHTLQENDEMNHLIGTANYAFEKKLLTRDELLHHFKSGQSFDLIHNDIAKPCIDHHRGILNIQANKILRGETVRHAGQNFNCVIKYLEHWQEHVDHKLLPMEKMDHVIDNQMSINRQMNRSHSMSI